jgi:hypothetical protein
MANDEFREGHEERREHGLKARHETREARAVRSDPVKALRYLLAQYDRVVEVHEHVVMDTPEDRELHDRAIATFREAAEPIRSALADSKEPTLTAAEVKVLTETAGEAGRRIGRKEASDEIAAAILRSLSLIIDANYPEVLIPRETAVGLAREVGTRPSQATGATSDATSGVPGHQEVSEAVRSPQEPCGHPDCPCVQMHSHPEGNTP